MTEPVATPLAADPALSTSTVWARALLMGFLGFTLGVTCFKYDLWPVGKGSWIRPGEVDEFATYEADKAWAKKLQAGGYILYMRHAQREKWNDVTAFDAVELLTKAKAESGTYKRAVCLTEQGVEESKLVGEVFRLANVKVDRIVTSPSCRARQTAMYAFGRIDQVANALLHRTAVMKDQHKAFAVETRKILDSLNPPAGSNSLISAHSGTMRFDGKTMIDIDETGGKPDMRDETGFIVLEKRDGKVIARHKFGSIKNLANAALELPVLTEDDAKPADKLSQSPKP